MNTTDSPVLGTQTSYWCDLSSIKTQLADGYQNLGIKALRAAQQIDDKSSEFITRHKNWIYLGAFMLLAGSLIDPTYAVTVDGLKDAVVDLKKEVFGGWMFVAKIAACAAGVAFTIAKQSLAPFGIGGAVGAGIHFWDKWIGDGSAALI